MIKKISQFIASKLVPAFSYPILKGPLKGMKIIHGSLGGPSGGASVYFDLIEKKQTSEFIKQTKKGDIVFDIGANVGYYTILASKIVGENGKIFSFEPVVRNLSYLYRHIKLNGLNNVVILPLACAEESTLKKFSFGRTIAEGHLLENNSQNSFDFLSYTYVHTIKIDDFCNYSGIAPDVLKIDVEGAELHVLKGAQQILHKSRPKIFLSIHSEMLEKECIEFLKNMGYHTVLIDEKERPSVEYLCY